MPRCRTASLETVRLPLSDGDWIEVKKTLCVRDGRAIQRAILAMDGTVLLAKWIAWMADWSLRDREDKPLPLTADGIDALALSESAEIGKVLDAHIAAMDEEKEKNRTTGEKTGSSPISSSPASSDATSTESAT